MRIVVEYHMRFLGFKVDGVGAIGVVETHEPVDVEALQARFVKAGVWIRPFGTLIYLMPPYITEADELHQLTQSIGPALDSL